MTMFHFLHKKDGFPANETVPKEAAPEIPMPPLSIMIFNQILYLIFDYPHKYNTFKHFDV